MPTIKIENIGNWFAGGFNIKLQINSSERSIIDNIVNEDIIQENGELIININLLTYKSGYTNGTIYLITIQIDDANQLNESNEET